jgi:hypothetical protein
MSRNIIFVQIYNRHKLLDLIDFWFCSQCYDRPIVSLVAKSWLSARIKIYVINAAHIV